MVDGKAVVVRTSAGDAVQAAPAKGLPLQPTQSSGLAYAAKRRKQAEKCTAQATPPKADKAASACGLPLMHLPQRPPTTASTSACTALAPLACPSPPSDRPPASRGRTPLQPLPALPGAPPSTTPDVRRPSGGSMGSAPAEAIVACDAAAADHGRGTSTQALGRGALVVPASQEGAAADAGRATGPAPVHPDAEQPAQPTLEERFVELERKNRELKQQVRHSATACENALRM